MADILTISADEYHADPCETPSLSASIAHILVTHSPAHAKAAHPRLNPDFVRVDKEAFDIGTICHSLLLEDGANVAVLPFPNWRKKEAQEARKEAREAGRTPLLEEDWVVVTEMVAAVRRQLDAHEADPPIFTDGLAEQTLVWNDGGVMCRARPDWLQSDYTVITDLKTSSRSANPAVWPRSAILAHGLDTQAAFYRRGMRAITGMNPDWRWVVVETAPPYALSVIAPAPDVLALGDAKIEFAINLWRECLERDSWPAYPAKVATVELPGWAEAAWLEREAQGVAA